VAGLSCWVGGGLALAGIARPNKSVKGTRRPVAVLKFGFYQGLAASFGFRWRRAPYRNVRLGESRWYLIGFANRHF